jgi:Family of unknown function (DUF5678)
LSVFEKIEAKAEVGPGISGSASALASAFIKGDFVAEIPDPVPSLDLSPYHNRWIALIRGRVVGVGLTAGQAERAAKRIRPKEKVTLVFVDGEGRVGEGMER